MPRIATKLYAARGIRTPLSPLIMMSDPDRVPDIISAAQNLPKGAALIYRHFGKAGYPDEARALREITASRGIQFLIGHDTELAETVGADGVHFRRDGELAGPKEWRARRPDWLISMAGLKQGSYWGDLSLLDGLFISSVFASNSPSAGEPLGIDAFTDIADSLNVPVFALGGIKPSNARRLIGTGAAGIAGVEAFQETRMNDLNIEAEVTDYGYRLVGRLEGFEETAELTLKKMKNGVYNANHTGVPKSMGGKGVGKALVKFLSAHARENNYRVYPGCPFIGVMWKRFPDWAEGVRAEKA